MMKSKNSVLIEKICPSCGCTFTCSERKPKKYCSQQCSIDRNEIHMEYCCDHCGVSMRIKKKLYEEKLNGKRKYIFCSKKCANEAKRTGHDIICDNCGNVFYRRQYHIDRQANNNQNNFCSIRCQKEYLHKQRFEERICEICGDSFEASRRSTQRFCSDECQIKWQTTRVGELNPNFTSILTPCSYCGREHYVKPYRFDEQEHFFCSVKCRQTWYAEVFSQQDEIKEASRQRILKQLESGAFLTETLPQNIVNELLDGMNIEYIREKSFEFFAVDNYIPFYNLVIEVQGDYWHTNPTRFTDKITQVQYDRIGRDKAKHSYFKNQYGIEILYLWEYDILHNRNLCQKLIQSYIDNRGVLLNYNSFNYHVINDVLILKQDVLQSYQEMPVETYKSSLQIIS